MAGMGGKRTLADYLCLAHKSVFPEIEAASGANGAQSLIGAKKDEAEPSPFTGQ